MNCENIRIENVPLCVQNYIIGVLPTEYDPTETYFANITNVGNGRVNIIELEIDNDRNIILPILFDFLDSSNDFGIWITTDWTCSITFNMYVCNITEMYPTEMVTLSFENKQDENGIISFITHTIKSC